MPRTAVVIMNWNGLGFLREFLGKVIDLTSFPDTEIVVADNGSTDGSIKWISQNLKSVRIIPFDENHGFAGGYNLAISQIEADYYVLLNSDIEVTKGWLQPLVSFLENNPGHASCQPKVLSYYRKEYFEHAGAAGGYIDKYGYPFCRGRIFDYIEMDNGQYDDYKDIFWSTGACMVVRADAWKRCGGFDSTFFAHMEEIDLCWRFHKAGYRVAYVPVSVVYHVGGGALPYDSPRKLYLNFRNSLFFLYKNLPEEKLMKVMFLRKLLDGVAAGMFLLRGNLKGVSAVWKAHMDFYRSLKEVKGRRKAVVSLGNSDINAPILNKSIVFEFYAKGHKTYQSLKTVL